MNVVRALAVVLLLAPSLFAHEGWGVVVHERLGVVVADIPANTIWRIDDGRVTPLLRETHSHALVLRDGAIYGTDASRVWRLDASGVRTFAMPRELGLQSFLIARDGTIYSANRYDHRKPRVVLLRRSRDGSVSRVSEPLTAIDGLRELPDGRLVIADGPSLRILGGASIHLTSARWGEDLLGLSSVVGSTVHVADHAGRRILRVDLATGRAAVADRSSFWWAPSGVEVAGGKLYVLEHLRPPLSLLGDLHVGPYLRVRRGAEVVGVVWGRRTWVVGVIAALVVAVVLILRRLRATTASPSAPRE